MSALSRRAVLATGPALLLAACAAREDGGLSLAERADVARVQASLNALHGMRARFVQTWPDGGTGGGVLSYDPGHMRLDYETPHPMLLVAGEGHIVLRDDSQGSVTRIALSRNPLGLLLATPLVLSGTICVTAVQRGPGALQLSMTRRDDPTEGLLTLTFADQGGALQLTGMQGVDARQHRIVLHLFGVTTGNAFPPGLFTPPSA